MTSGQAELDLEHAKALADPVERNIRVHEAEQRLLRAQRRELEASIRRRARLAKH